MRVPSLVVLSGLMLSPVTPASPAAQDPRVERAVAPLEWREIGPAIMGGRISDLAVVEANPAVMYVGTATAGVWKSTNHGTSWTPLFDDQPTASVGDVTLAPSNPNVVWVGTGEPQNRQSSPWGNGVYESRDGGRTWTHRGLEETRHIARIVVHPREPDIVYVAAVGHLWGANPERGVYKTTNGGVTWEQVLYVDEHTGAIDLVMDPGDPQTLFAAMYQRRRTNFGFNGGGPGSGIYRTVDGGVTWRELTNGLPTGDKGRIGLDVYRGDGNVVYATVEADRRGGFGAQNQSSGPRESGVYRSTDRGETWEQLSETNPRPMYFSLVRIDPNDPERIYLGGVQLMISDDGGRTFRGERSVHSDHHAIWIDPANSDHVILGSDGGVSASFDGGDSWRMYDNLPIAQFYEIGVDMRDPYYVCGGLQDNGSWCGPSRTYSTKGIRNRDWYNIGGGDGFYVRLDPTDHRTGFGESQGGNVYRFDLTTGERQSLRPSAPRTDDDDADYRWNWNTPIVMSSHDPATLYLGANVLFRSTDRGHSWEAVSPDLTKQIDRSELPIMGRLPTDDMLSRHDGISSYGNITTITESAVNARLIYVGTDDGNVQRSRDGGATWDDLTPRFRDLPDQTYVSRLVASRFSEGRVYATFDGHTNDDYRPYVFVSDDFGDTWRAITSGLPAWSVNIVAEHPRTPNVVFVGNEAGVYVSIDGGDRWTRLKNNLPTVPVDDIIVHPRDNDLIVGTHGRGVWIVDDITPLEVLSDEVLASDVHLFPVRPSTLINVHRPQGWNPGTYEAPNPPTGARIRYYLREAVSAAGPVVTESGEAARGPMTNGGAQRRAAEDPAVTVTILDDRGEVIRTLDGEGQPGIREIVWDLRYAPPFETDNSSGGFFGPPRGPSVMPGTYTIRLDAGGRQRSGSVIVRGDPRITVSQADRQARHEAVMSVYVLAGPIHSARGAVRELSEQITSVRALVRDRSDVPDALQAAVDTLRRDVRDLGQRVARANRMLRVGNAIDGVTARPTADQQRQIDEAWEEVPALIDALNEMITSRMPALNRRLDEHGVRPDPGEPIPVPRRP